MAFERYQSFAPIDLPIGPGRRRSSPRRRCGVRSTLRDGNQALIEPMDSERKWKMFTALVDMGFKEIEVGFPSASETDFDFVREIIERNAIPDDVTIQVLVQCRTELIDRTYESIAGAKQAIVHFYNSTSTLQRRWFSGWTRTASPRSPRRPRPMPIAGVPGARHDGPLRVLARVVHRHRASVRQADLRRGRRCLGTDAETKAIINLPATVEMSSANIYGDMIEWMHRNLAETRAHHLEPASAQRPRHRCRRGRVRVMAGADRVEGTLFGNGERTGNVDVVTWP